MAETETGKRYTVRSLLEDWNGVEVLWPEGREGYQWAGEACVDVEVLTGPMTGRTERIPLRWITE
jgi:hypothetical protein